MRCWSRSSSVFGSPMLGKVIRRGEDVIVDGEQLALDEVRLDRLAEAQRHVGLAHGEVEFAVVEDEAQADARIELEELVDALGQPGRAEADGGGDAERAARLFAGLGEGRAHRLELDQHLVGGA